MTSIFFNSKNIKYKILFCFWCKITNSFVFKNFNFSKKVNLFLFCNELITFCKLNNILYFFFNLNTTFNFFNLLFFKLNFFKYLKYFFRLNRQSFSILYWKSNFDFLETLEKNFKLYFLFILEINKKYNLKLIRSLEFHKLYLKELRTKFNLIKVEETLEFRENFKTVGIQCLSVNRLNFFKNFCLVRYNRIFGKFNVFLNKPLISFINKFSKNIFKLIKVFFLIKLQYFIFFFEKVKLKYAENSKKFLQFKFTFLFFNFIKNFLKVLKIINYCFIFQLNIKFFSIFTINNYSFFFFINKLFFNFLRLTNAIYCFFCYGYKLFFSLIYLNSKNIKNLQLNTKLVFYLFYYNYRQKFIDKIKKYNKLSFFLNFLFKFYNKKKNSNKFSKFIRIFFFYYKMWKKIKNFTFKKTLMFGKLSIMKYFQQYNYFLLKKKLILLKIKREKNYFYCKENPKVRTLWPRALKIRHPVNLIYNRVKKFEAIRNHIGSCVINKSKFNYFLTMSDAFGKTIVTRNLGFLKYIKFKKHEAYRPKTFINMAESVVAACSKKKILYLNLKICCTLEGLHVEKTVKTLMKKGLVVRRLFVVKKIGYNGLRVKKPKRL